MKSALLLIILQLVYTSFCCGQSELRPDERTLSVIRKFGVQYEKGMMEGKVDAFRSFMSENIRLMPAFQKTVMGSDHAIKYYEAFVNRFSISNLKRQELEIIDLGNRIVEIGTMKMTLTLKQDKIPHVIDGTFMNIWEDMSDTPKLVTSAWNYDTHYGKFTDEFRFEDIPSIHEAMLPNVPITNSVTFELAALNRLLDATVTEHDNIVWRQYYADDAMLIPGNRPLRKGRKAIDDYIDMHVRELPVFQELDIRNNQVDVSGEFVIEYASHIASWRSGESSGVGLGKNIRIWRRQNDRSLKIFRSIGMYD